ncbi:10-deacetylbaccatin III 10-O-acetyltransferase [Iris pallida]|uniref:10-deacetylbaccatin III 10-O-acetyltransferase n=1 Tax=Iris pallida TaxID=29817 RepID=A0AAX6FWB6_IRIPA|nr:10-deacetylbaccatin III 10-O-acetyltransferase [Iris pallida]
MFSERHNVVRFSPSEVGFVEAQSPPVDQGKIPVVRLRDWRLLDPLQGLGVLGWQTFFRLLYNLHDVEERPVGNLLASCFDHDRVEAVAVVATFSGELLVQMPYTYERGEGNDIVRLQVDNSCSASPQLCYHNVERSACLTCFFCETILLSLDAVLGDID